MSNFQERLLNLRKASGLTQKQLALASNLSEIGIKSYEQCKREPAYRQLLALADAFNVSIDYLVGRSDNPARLS